MSKKTDSLKSANDMQDKVENWFEKHKETYKFIIMIIILFSLITYCGYK
jgi:hypothetical protein